METAPAVVPLSTLAREATASGAIWSHAGDDLNVNLVRLAAGEGVGEHVNDEVEVLLVGIAGAGSVAVDGQVRNLRAGEALIVPRGARRAIQGAGPHFAYLTCHRRRDRLWPRRAARLPPPPGSP